MSDAATDSTYFSQSVAKLGDHREMHTTKPVWGAQGVKILDAGVKVTPRLYERLVQHRPTTPLEDAISIDAAVNGQSLRALAEELLDQNPVVARMAELQADRSLLLDCLEAVPLPKAKTRECSKKRSTTLITRMRSDTPGTPGRKQQMPRTMRSISTPALLAAYSARMTGGSTSALSLAMMRPAREMSRVSTVMPECLVNAWTIGRNE